MSLFRGVTSSGVTPFESEKLTKALKIIYREKILPVEKLYQFDGFVSPFMTEADFDARPQILLLGQYSTGKTSFLRCGRLPVLTLRRWLLERDFPGMNIGPEPTTDRFMAIMWGDCDRITPGNAATTDPAMPFGQLATFGSGFLTRFQVTQVKNPVLEQVSFIDTPGVLSGTKQTEGRGYDFVALCRYFASQSDLVLVMFDAHKMDISDEFKKVCEALRGHDDKMRFLLNKSDLCDAQGLMRVYGALMWQLGKIVSSPEVGRVYISSFWEQPYKNTDNVKLFDAERRDLLNDIRDLPKQAAMRKINEVVKRVRAVRVHALIIAYLHQEMPSMLGKERKQQQLIDSLPDVFNIIHQKNHHIPITDFPNVKLYQRKLAHHNFSMFAKFRPAYMDGLESALAQDLPVLIKQLQKAQTKVEVVDPFASGARERSISIPPNVWLISDEDKARYDKIFMDLEPDEEGYTQGLKVKEVLVKSKLPTELLQQIWKLSDIDKDGRMDADEFAVSMYLTENVQKAGPKKYAKAVPATLPPALVPPKYRKTGEHAEENPFAE